MINHFGLFGGLGGFAIAADRLGIHNAFINEWDKNAVATVKANFPSAVVSSKDIRILRAEELESISGVIDILTAGFPCQSFSQAGENRGFKDQRGRLFFEIPRLISECTKPPKVVLLENVAFLKTFDHGSRLRVVLNAMRKCGYWVSDQTSTILDTFTYTRSPQRRERLFIVCAHRDYYRKNHFRFPERFRGKKLDLWDIVDRTKPGPDNGYLPCGNKYEQKIRDKAEEENCQDRLYQIRRVEARACQIGVCPTLTANMGTGGHNIPFVLDEWGIRKLTVRECMHLQTIKDHEIEFPSHIPEKDCYAMVGNAVTADLAELLFNSIIEHIFERDKIRS